MSDTLITLSEEQVRRYLQLTDRSIFISLHSGASWKPEYAQELEEIDREIATLRPAIDAAIAARHLARGQKQEAVSEDVISNYNDSEDIQSGQEQETVSEDVISDCNDSEDTRPGQDQKVVSGNVALNCTHSGTLTLEQELRYLELIERSKFLSSQSGVSWRPEYTQELEIIDQEIDALQAVISSSGQAGKVPLSNT